MIKIYDLHNKNILEIGCCKGNFLLLLFHFGNNKGTGIDPSDVPGRIDNEAVEEVTFIKDYYGEQHAKDVGNFIYCCQTLEHIQLTFEFINSLRRSIGYRHVPVFFELPVLPVFSRI
ncbi:methyltransferase domain-containing protein [Richelia intracellularis]|uniref:methyltransferase domain-containing protein n=1 Tax=Richelia intracellularis TaxID=1164990 RepID=UPI002F2B563E